MLKKIFQKLFMRAKQRDQRRKISSLFRIMSESDGEQLASGEQRRIFFDEERGEFYSKITSSGGGAPPAMAQEVPAANYPPESESPFAIAEDLLVKSEGQVFHLTIHQRAAEPEADDILRSRADGRDYLVHPQEIYEQVMAAESRFLSDLEAANLDRLKSTAALAVNFMDDSRNYREIAISGRKIQVPCHYLGLTFLLFMIDDEMFVITEHVHDENGDQVPRFLTRIEPGFVSRTSARFDEEEEMWFHEEKVT